MEENEEIIQFTESVLENEEPLRIEKWKANLDTEDFSNKNKLFHQRKNQYSALKYKCKDSETRYLLFQHLEDGTDLPVEAIGKELKQSAKGVRAVKSDLQDLRAEREELSYTVNAAYSEHLQLKEELRSLQQEIQQLKSDVISKEEQEEDVSEEVLAEMQRAVDEKKAEALKVKQMGWLKNYIEVVEQLSQVRLKFRGGDHLLLELMQGPGAGAGDTLEATVALSGNTVDDIKLSLLSLDADDICQSTVQQNFLRAAVSRLHSRWQHHRPLLDELNDLRHRFVLDWLPEESRVTVLYGNDAHMMCVLHVEEGYPASGKIKLISTSGLPENVEQDTLAPPAAKASLTEWLEHMRSRLSPSTESSEDS